MISLLIRRRTALLCLFVSCFALGAAAYTPPVIRSLNADNVRYAQVGSTVGIDLNSDATVLAGTAPDFNRALLTVTITQGVVDEDSLLIRPLTTGTARITLQGRKVLYNGVIIGTYQPTLAWRSLTVRFNERASSAAVTAVIRRLAYTNLNNLNPTVVPRSISVAVSDGYGSVSAISVVWVAIQMARPLPVAAPDYYRVPTGQTSLTIPAPGVLKNDYHPDKGSYDAKLIRDTPVGHVIISRDGSLQYIPQPGATGTYTATYSVCDTWGGCASAAITFHAGGENEAPQTRPDHYRLQEHRGLFISNPALGVLANDTDANSGSSIVHTATLITPPAHGTLLFYPNGTFQYHPAADYHGVDTFVYSTCDTENACAEGVATITIADVDYAPYAPDIILSVTDTTLITGDLLRGVVNYDKDPLQASILTEPAWGTLSRADEGSFSYISRANQDGIERLLFQVCDGGTQCDTATLVIVVANSNSKPAVFLPAVLSVREDTPTALHDISFSDADAGTNSVRVTFETTQTGSTWTTSAMPPDLTIVRNGTRVVNITGPIPSINNWLKQQGLLFTPTKDATGGQSIRVTINDLGNTGNDGAQQTAVSKSIAIIAVNDAPGIRLPGNQTMKEDELLTFIGERAIRISDVDANAEHIVVTISATRGAFVVKPATGETNSTEVSTLTLTGRLDSINAALTTLAFRPLKPGVAAITVTSNDLGNVGEGGPQTATGTMLVDVIAAPATITRVTAHAADGLYKAGDRITLAVEFSHSVWVSHGTPTLALATSGGSDAVYQGGSGTPQLLFDYTVRVGDSTPRLNYVSTQALSLNGATLRDSLATDAVLTLPGPGSKASLKGTSHLSVDGILPAPPQLTTPEHNSSIDTGILMLVGISEIGSHVLITLDGNIIGTTTTNAAGGWDYRHDETLYVGKHTLTLQAADSAGNISDPSAVTILYVNRGTVVSTEPNEHGSVPRIYPVPAKDNLFVNIGGSLQAPIRIQIVDSRGILQTDIHWERHDHTIALNVSSLSGGLYVLVLKTANEQYNKKVIIVK